MRGRQWFVNTTSIAMLVAGLAIVSGGTATAAGSPPKLTKAKAEAKARAALPAVADVGADFTQAPSVGPSVAQVAGGLPGCKQIAKTFPGGTKRGVGGAARSYNRALDTVFIDISLFRNTSDAKLYMGTARSDKALECEKQFFESVLEQAFPGTQATVIDGAPLQVSPADVDEINARGGSLQVSGGFSQPLNTVEMRKGRAVSTVVFSASLTPDEMERIVTLVATGLAGL